LLPARKNRGGQAVRCDGPGVGPLFSQRVFDERRIGTQQLAADAVRPQCLGVLDRGVAAARAVQLDPIELQVPLGGGELFFELLPAGGRNAGAEQLLLERTEPRENSVLAAALLTD